MNRYITKESFEFMIYNGGTIPITIGKGVLISYEVYTHEPCFNPNNAVRITVYGPNSNLTLEGPNLICIENYIREIEYNDLIHPHEYMFEQSKGDRTYREGQKDNTVVVDSNELKKENIECIIRYLAGIDQDKVEPRIGEWIESERERLGKEHDKLSILTASDDEIIQNALLSYSNDCLAHYDTETANKIRDVRERYLEMIEGAKNENN